MCIEYMKRAHYVVVAIALAAVVCVVGCIVLLSDQNGVVGTYSYGYESFDDYPGILTSDDGSIINLNDVEDASYLITLWDDKDFSHYDKIIGYSWLVYYVDFECTPGLTISAEDIHIAEEYYSEDNRYITAFIELNGKIYHHEDSDVKTTLGSDGRGRITMIILSSEYNPHVPSIAVEGIVWKLND